MNNIISFFAISVILLGIIGCGSGVEEIPMISLQKKGMDYGNNFANKVLEANDPETIIEAMNEYQAEIEKILPDIEKNWEMLKNNSKKYKEMSKAYKEMSKKYINEQKNIAKAMKVIWNDYKDDEEIQDVFKSLISVLKKASPWQ